MTAAPTFTAPPPQRPVRRPPPPAPEPPTRPLLPHDGSPAAVGGARGKPNKFSSIDPLLCQVGLVAFIVAVGVALTVYLLLRLLPPAVVTEAGLWSIAAEARRMLTGLFG
jgi:hypothetical protein